MAQYLDCSNTKDMEIIRDTLKTLIDDTINHKEFIKGLEPRCISITLTKLEEALFWLDKHTQLVYKEVA